jgi:UDP-N-acetylglucosamine transferase subunit ALG13
MILVTTGSNGPPFDRLLSVVERLDLDETIVVQHGPSRIRPKGATCVDFVPFRRLKELVVEARVVVAHAGTGSILVCASAGRVPIVVPRRARFREVVDDHQLVLARRLHKAGTVVCIEDPEALPAAVSSHRGAWARVSVPSSSSMVLDLKAYLEEMLL